MHKNDNYMSLSEASKYMGNLHQNYVRKLAQTEEIPAVKFSDSPKAQWFFKRKDLDNWAKENAKKSRDNLINPKIN